MNPEAKAKIKAALKAVKAKGRKEFGISESLVDEVDDLEPDWDSGDLNGYAAPYPPRDDITIYQQDELLYPVLYDIADKGLGYVYSKYKTGTGTSSTTANPRKIIVVGAGIAGLAAAYELIRAGHTVQILEMQARAGGRIHTYGEKDGFAKSLYVDAGAMRLPDQPSTTPKTHYLTDFYVTQLGLSDSVVPFKNYDANAFVKFYDMAPITRTEWDSESKVNFDKYWPGWDATFANHADIAATITSINDYYAKTFDEITKLLKTKVDEAETNEEAAQAWDKWTEQWSRFALNGIMRSTVNQIKETLDDDYLAENPLDEELLEKLIPWPEIAIVAFSVFNYTEQLDQSLVLYLRDELGVWWSDHMHHIEGGMERIPQGLLLTTDEGGVTLENKVVYNITVQKIEYKYVYDGTSDATKVIAYHSISGQTFEYDCDAVIITVPLHAVRQIEFVNGTSTSESDSFPNQFHQAVEDIWYGPSTKIMIQSKRKFWLDSSITGGFSKTNLPIGQLHYPTEPAIQTAEDEYNPGILLCYTWKAEALLFGSLRERVAIEQVVREIAKLHPEITELYEAGAIHAWYSDPAAQGAYVLLKPHQYRHVKYLMNYPHKNLFFAGEGISHAPGWIQGALESAFRAAYQFYLRNEENLIVVPPKKK